MPSNERDALIAALNDDTAAAHIYPSTLKTFQRGEHGGECWSIKVGNEDEESVGVFTVQQVIDALAATAPNAGAPMDLHAAVMNLPGVPERSDAAFVLGYRSGHRDARHGAAELIAAAAPAQQAGAPTPQQISDYLNGLDAVKRAVVEREARAAGAPLPLVPSESVLDELIASATATVDSFNNSRPDSTHHASDIARLEWALHAHACATDSSLIATPPQATLPASDREGRA